MDSQAENRVANNIGSVAYWYMAQCTSTALCYGASVSLFYASVKASSKRQGGSPKARKYLFALTCFMFLMNTGLFVVFIANDLTLISWARDAITQDTPPLADRLLASSINAVPYSISEDIFEIMNFLIGDTIVLWRASVFWPHSRLIQGGLCSLLLGDIAASLYDIVKISTIFTQSGGEDTTSMASIDAARILVSLGVNFLATLCIAVKAWHLHRTLGLSFSRATTKKSVVIQILTLLIECGLLFCAIQLFYALYYLVLVPRAADKPATHPMYLFEAAMGPFFSFFAGLYPSIVILVMARQQSIFGTETFATGSQNTPAANGTDQRQSQALSTLNFASIQEGTGQTGSESRSITENLQEFSKHGIHVVFSSEAEKAV